MTLGELYDRMTEEERKNWFFFFFRVVEDAVERQLGKRVVAVDRTPSGGTDGG